MAARRSRTLLVAAALSAGLAACRSMDGMGGGMGSGMGPSSAHRSFVSSGAADGADLTEGDAPVPAQGTASSTVTGFAPPGTKAELGELAPDFTLNDLAGNPVSLARSKGKIVVLEWFSPTCEYCRYAYASGPLRTLPSDLKRKGIVWLTINSELADQQGGNEELNREFMARHGSQSPLLFDRSGEVARMYGAKTTPQCFVINANGKLVYRGALDNAPLGKVSGDVPKTNYVEAAVADLKSGHAVMTRDIRPYGCQVRLKR